jgi:spore germination protein YaaH
MTLNIDFMKKLSLFFIFPSLLFSFLLLAFSSFLLFPLSPFLVHAQTATTSPFGQRIFYYSTLKSNVADFTAHAKDIDIIAPQTYEVTAALTASGTVPSDLAQAAQTNHVKVMPLIANHNFSQTIIHSLLASSTAENNLTTFLVSSAQSKEYIGWQLDLEHIASTDRNAFSSFVEKTTAVLHSHGLILSIAVVAQNPDKSSSDPSSSYYKNWSGAYDYARLGMAADFLSLMAYDDPDSTGPSAPLPFVKSAIENILASVPSSKISLGIPLYYWGWSTGSHPVRLNSGGAYEAAMQRLSAYPSFQGFNASVGVPWIIYRLGQKIYMIWFENAQSFSLKAALVNTYHLRGFSAWVLGSEDQEIWNVLGK